MNKKAVQKKSKSGNTFDKKSIKPKIAEGYIHVRAIIEIVGKPIEYVEDSLKNHMNKLKSEEGIEIIDEKYEKALPNENYFSAFAELELLAEDLDTLFTFCYDYMPSSVEVIDPEQLVVKNTQITDMLNDLQTRMHGLNTGFIQERENSLFYIKNTAVLLRNFIVVLLSSKPMTIAHMEPLLGIRREEIEKVLNVLISEEKVRQEGEFYKVIPKSH